MLDDEWTFETKSIFLRNLLLRFIYKCPFSFVKNKLVSGATTIQVEGLIQTKVVIKISKYYKYLNVLICYSKYKEENENVFFIVTNKGTLFSIYSS